MDKKSLKSFVNIDLYKSLKALSHIPMKTLFDIDVEGLENIPKQGPVIIAANHRSFIDSIFLPLIIDRKVTFVAKAEYFDSIKTRWFFKATGQIPIRRDSTSSGAGALLSAKDILEKGEIFGIYPEGSRTRDGFLHKGHTGVARLALETNATLIPIGLIGTEHVQATDEKVPRFLKNVKVNIGKPINYEKYKNVSNARTAYRNLTDELMYEIFLLCGYGYVDTYVKNANVN
ncbi:MAG: lysophospholipid acyltransferase family protein [Acidimicrobiia bacterium]